ncbi:hypothetical protein KTQ89_06725 [Holdemanella porci]|uniref:hypothetical protein n=2 Tax=Holdemanella porci TaxID=2652276 RepID=UPI001C2CB786|nr:hypothetical protein [Holdemanella porci]MBU9872055.1 hypothetical protein [Holdemanella porci]
MIKFVVLDTENRLDEIGIFDGVELTKMYRLSLCDIYNKIEKQRLFDGRYLLVEAQDIQSSLVLHKSTYSMLLLQEGATRSYYIHPKDCAIYSSPKGNTQLKKMKIIKNKIVHGEIYAPSCIDKCISFRNLYRASFLI